MLLLQDDFYYLNTTPLEDEEKEAAIEFVCACNYLILMTGYAPHLLHPITLMMMLHSEPCIEDDFTNAYPFKISEKCTTYLNNMKGKQLHEIKLNYDETTSNSAEEWIRDYGAENCSITCIKAKKLIQKGNWVMKIKEKLIMDLLKNPGVVRQQCMSVFMDRIGENINEYCEMYTHGLPKSKILFQHITMVSNYESFLKDVKKSFATETLNNITYIKKMSIIDKLKIGEIFKKRALSFYIKNKEKYRWLITKHIAIWFLYATEEQIKRVHKTLTSGNISIGKRGIILNFEEIYEIPNAKQSHYFHPHSCSNTLDACYHDVFMGKDIINYHEFENVWNRDIDPQVYTTL